MLIVFIWYLALQLFALADWPLAYSPVGALAAHLALVLIGVGVAASAAINYYERALWDVLAEGPRPTWHSPAQRNAYDSLKTHFTKGDEDKALTGENYLERVPAEPSEGRAYGYSLLASERYDLFNPRDREGTRESYDTMPMLPMPPQFAEDPRPKKDRR